MFSRCYCHAAAAAFAALLVMASVYMFFRPVSESTVAVSDCPAPIHASGRAPLAPPEGYRSMQRSAPNDYVKNARQNPRCIDLLEQTQLGQVAESDGAVLQACRS